MFAIMPYIQALRKRAPAEPSNDRSTCFFGHGRLPADLRTTALRKRPPIYRGRVYSRLTHARAIAPFLRWEQGFSYLLP